MSVRPAEPSPTPAPRAVRVGAQPIVPAGAAPGYEAIFNAGIVHHEGSFHLFARAVRAGYRRNPGSGPRFLDYRSDLVVFTSTDGLHYRFQQVLAESSDDGVYAYEDPRVQRITSAGEAQWVMTYTNLPAPASGLPWRIGVHRLGFADGAFHLNHTSGRVVGPDGVPNKDAVLFNLTDGRVALLHRVHPDIQLAVFDSLAELWEPPSGYWDEHLRDLERHTVLRPAPGALGIGAGAPPVTIDDALVLFYHERGADGRYTANAALLDDRSGRVISVLPEPILEPELPWERSGDVDEVVFVEGAVVREDGDVYLSYGAADRCVGAAIIDGRALVSALRAVA